MRRTDFYNITTVDDIEEFDYLYNNMSQFDLKYPVKYYRVTDADYMRPDVISYQMYNSVDYWWVICYINRIMNPITDLTVGKLLVIPNILDIYDFNKKSSIR